MNPVVLLSIAAVAFVAWFMESRRRVRHPVPSGLNADESVPHESEFELYHNALSLCSMKTRVCLAELQIPYRSHHIDLIETGCYENIRSPFLKVNPAGTVPVLVHNGHPVYESHVQIQYAAEHAPEGSPKLVPQDPAQVAAMKYWIDQSAIIGDPLASGPISAGNSIPGLTVPLFASMVDLIPFWKITEGLLFHFDKRRPLVFLVMKIVGLERLQRLKPAIKVYRESRVAMEKHLDALENQLGDGGGPWILGEQYTLADVSWLVIFERMVQADSMQLFLEGTSRSKVTKYWEMLKARPSYQAAILEHQHVTVTRGTARLKEMKKQIVELQNALEG